MFLSVHVVSSLDWVRFPAVSRQHTFYFKRTHLWVNSSPAKHPSILSNLSGSNLRWQQTKQSRQNVRCPRHIFQWFQRNPKVLTGYSLNIISPAFSGSSLGSPLNLPVGLAWNIYSIYCSVFCVKSWVWCSYSRVICTTVFPYNSMAWLTVLLTLMCFRRFKNHHQSPYLALQTKELAAISL